MLLSVFIFFISNSYTIVDERLKIFEQCLFPLNRTPQLEVSLYFIMVGINKKRFFYEKQKLQMSRI